MLHLRIGDRIKIKTKPKSWDSRLTDVCPLNLNYPLEGIVLNKKVFMEEHHTYIALSVGIENVLYGFSETTLVPVCEIINPSKQYESEPIKNVDPNVLYSVNDLRDAFDAGQDLIRYEWHMDEQHGSNCHCTPIEYNDFNDWFKLKTNDEK